MDITLTPGGTGVYVMVFESAEIDDSVTIQKLSLNQEDLICQLLGMPNIDTPGIHTLEDTVNSRRFMLLYNPDESIPYSKVIVFKYIKDGDERTLVDCGSNDLDIVGDVRKELMTRAAPISVSLQIRSDWPKKYSGLLTDIAYACEKGTLFEQNYESAMQLYQLAAEAGDERAISNCGWLYQNGFGVEKNVEKAIELYEKAAAAGNTTAMVNLGNIYENGDLGEPDYEKCFLWYGKAAEAGDEKGLFNYANCYHWGYGTETDYTKSFSIFKQLADEGYEGASFYVGYYYQDGLGVEKDYTQARKYYRLGVLESDAFCFNQLGVMYAKGQGVKKDMRAAFDYYLQAAEMGDTLAYVNVAWCYEVGAVGEPNPDEALKYYQMAAEQGEEHALDAVKRLSEDISSRDSKTETADMENDSEIKKRQKENEKYLDVIRGSMIGGAVGDALGYPVEFYSLSGIRERYGEAGINHFKLDSQGLAQISDDTQMTLFTATGILLGQTRGMTRGIGGYYPDYIWRCYQMWYAMQMGEDVSKRDYPFTWLCDVPEMGENRAPGNTCMSALGSGEHGTMEHPLNNSKGCGGIMRVAPVGLYMNRNPQDRDEIEKLDLVAAETAAITHGHELGYMPAAALAHIINRIVYSGMEPEAAVSDAIQTMVKIFRGKKHLDDMISLMQQAVNCSKNDKTDEENIRSLGEGWVAEETLAIAIYCALKYKDDFSAAVVAAVNHDGDSDSTGAVTGNIVGARIGYEAIPEEWKQNLECKDVILEIADDLCHDCQIEEYDYDQDPEWECKYIECRKYKRGQE